MTVNNTHSNQSSSTAQAILRTQEAKENRQALQEINNEQVLQIQEEIDTSAITGLGGSINITG